MQSRYDNINGEHQENKPRNERKLAEPKYEYSYTQYSHNRR